MATTQWSQVLAARDAAGTRARDAMESLCASYWEPRIWEGVRREPPEVADTAWKPVVAKALAAMPEGRYPSASAVARALEEVTLHAAGDEHLRP